MSRACSLGAMQLEVSVIATTADVTMSDSDAGVTLLVMSSFMHLEDVWFCWEDAEVQC
jgi:hypothetical protein